MLKHIAIIMDGNGRWAKERGHPRLWGHVRGSSGVSHIVEAASDLGVQSLTLYAFSSENWSRPVAEIQGLFLLLKKFLQRERKKIIANKIRFKVIGEKNNLPINVRELIEELEKTTANFSGLKLNFAFSYGSRQELLASFKKFAQEYDVAQLNMENFSQCLSLPECGEVDLLIRTGGDFRLSNFLLWQVAYAELYFTDILWPDFSADNLRDIIDQVLKRERRFGSLKTDMNFKEVECQAEKNKEYFNHVGTI